MKRKKRKLKIKNIFILLIILSAFIYGGYYFMYKSNTFDEILSEPLYSEDAISAASDLNIESKLENISYSKTLEEMLINLQFIEDYFDEYLEITYIDDDEFLNNVNLYLSIGYNSFEVNNIFLLSEKNQEKLKNLDYTDFSKYIEITNYNADNAERYEAYLSENNLDVQTTVTYVNINLDLEFYEVVTEIEDKSSCEVLVNKFNSLTSDYEPDNLVALENFETYYMVEEAAEYFTKMIAAASEDGFTFEPFSAYRSAAYQSYLYNYYSSVDGEEAASTYSAKSGHSEHQTGLAVDIKNPSYYAATGTSLNDEDYAWILENSYKYGFIVRYPADSTDITGYIEEAWHLRYLGVELATSVYKSGLTYDEYYDLYIMEY